MGAHEDPKERGTERIRMLARRGQGCRTDTRSSHGEVEHGGAAM